MRMITWSLALLLLSAPLALADDVGFVEDFALAKDRAAALAQLIPGTEDYYYYHCLHALNNEQYAKVQELTQLWLTRFGQTPRFREIQTRNALLTYTQNPQRSLDFLKQQLNLRFDQQKFVPGAAPNLPTSLDPRLITREVLKTRSLQGWRNLDNFEDAALGWLAAEDLNWERRRHLLQRLTRPDLPNLPRLIVEDLSADPRPEFGAYPIHHQLTLAQLQELLTLRPTLLNQTAFVNTWLIKLRPGADEDWRHEPELAKAYIDRMLGFVRQLNASHNNLKAHVLFNRLLLDRTQGVYDRALFIEYLTLPRHQPYMSKALLESNASRQFPADLNADFMPVTMFPPIRTDESLVRSYLEHFFVAADSPREFEPYINDVYLRQLFAEIKISLGLGEPEQWASQIPPEIFRQFKERVDIDFAFTNKTNFAADEPVKLDLRLKNVPTLLVKVFEINTRNFYREHQREANTDINLDGLVANSEQTLTFPEAPLRRIDRQFTFPQLTKPGVYVVDFIGNGKSSRALVRKGRLRPLIVTSTAGQLIRVVDDANRIVKNASVWLGGQEYQADADGAVNVPFSTHPGRVPMVVSNGAFNCLDYLDHQAENYHLEAGIHVDREALLAQRVASVLIRPGIYLNEKPVSMQLLEEVKLRITSTDHDGIATSTEIPNFKLFEDRESIHEFRVPARLGKLTVQLEAKVKSLSQNKKLDLTAAQTFELNKIDLTDKIEDLHFAKFGTDYVLELLGRTGEAEPDRVVNVTLKHRDFREPVQVVLKADARGRVFLGPLAEIERVSGTGPSGLEHTWKLPTDEHSYRQLLQAQAGQTLTVPYLGEAETPSRNELALFELRDDVIEADRFDALAIHNGLLELRGLAGGDYDLWLKRTGEKIRIRVVDGPIVDGFILGHLRNLQAPALKPVQIQSIETSNDVVKVRLRDVSPFARVHVFATRYRPAYSAFADLGKIRDAMLTGVYSAHAESVYLTGRNIGDEYRYVLDRKGQPKFPGNMAERPALLLNPWALRSTQTGEQIAAAGEGFGASPQAPASSPVPAPGIMARLADKSTSGETDSANLDYLAEASAVLVNLIPDKDGVITIPRAKLGAHSMIQVVAVDPLSTTVRSITLPEQPAKFLDLRLLTGLDPKGHFTQQKQVSILAPGKPFVVADAAASRFEAYDSLARVYALYATLSNDPKLAEFSFLLNWPKLKDPEKRVFYSKYACHELHVFLAKKDPAFFKEVVQPYLANKKEKTFVDRWLLEENLSEFLTPWKYEQLNTIERVMLAQRIAGEPARTVRYLDEIVRLQPPNADRLRVLFETGLKASELEALGVDKLGRPMLWGVPALKEAELSGRVSGGNSAADATPALGFKKADKAMDSIVATSHDGPWQGGRRGTRDGDGLSRAEQGWEDRTRRQIDGEF